MSFRYRCRGWWVNASWAIALFGFGVVADGNRFAQADEPLPERVEFNRDVRPILSDVCFHCHGPDAAQRKGDLRLDTHAGATADLGDGRRAIVPEHAEQSELVRRVESTDADLQMPPPDSGRTLSSRQQALLRRWVAQGAKWDLHWSFVRPVRAELPRVKRSEWARGPIDLFVAARLEQEGIPPSRMAERTTLLRRATLDLTGLPPSPDDMADFLRDESPDAWERQLDRLLASPRYGERMAVRWANAARYADTSGYQSDGERTMWRWRDWVIDAYNANMAFDQFTVQQLAGDLLPDPTLEQQIATGFNRNHRGNAEGGIIPEEYAVEYVVDRVETTATVWLGLTLMCARCHNHKYDPLPQSDFYQMFAFFNNVPEKGRAVKYGNSPPFLTSPTQSQQRDLAQIDRRLSAAQATWAALQSDVASTQEKWERQQVPDVPAAAAVRHGLILHFPLDGNSSTVVSLPSANGRPVGYLGQLRTSPVISPSLVLSSKDAGDPLFVSAGQGMALQVDDQHHAAVGDVANFGFFDPFSISAWIRPEGDRGGTVISRMTDAMHGDGWCVVLEQGKVQVHLTKRWLDDACRIETVDSIEPGRWRQISVTYDGSRETAGIQIFVDGLPWRSVTLLDELNQSFDNKGPLRIGGGNGPDGRFHGLIDEVRIFDRVLSADEAAILAVNKPLSAIAATPKGDRTAAQTAALRLFFVQQAADETIRTAWTEQLRLRDERSRFVDGLPTTMVMCEMPQPRDTHVLLRGEYDKPGERVGADVPASVMPLAHDAPRNRLGLARWLVNPAHPLTARVAVNRCWQMLFGIGLVKTVDDFGQQGEWPSHPELLDWLAIEFQGVPASSSQWDTKRLLRQVTSSATYQQSSRTSDELQQRDPENRWLARGPRFRLSAEMVRDQALAASGLLVEQLGGPSVRPYQPDGLWKDLAGIDYEQDHGASLYRRGLYTYWKRTVAPPSMVTFDAGGRETCIVKETRTNTPLQALNLMNDVTYVEAARVLGEAMMREADATPSQRIDRAFLRVLGRTVHPVELAVLSAGYADHLAHFRMHLSDAETLTKQGESVRAPHLDVAELAACTTVAGLILNLDETVTRE
ncbi:DUF1553 domain-containing protein [Schlesneria paludicola]|uniref:DUF1553 domain-containing protein n=1 Tax=Schlesneria paludicola TaxID=360056 RepID=UPI00029B221F|nr:DUF1553 domain-containing protein [Schlesneria paludicola]